MTRHTAITATGLPVFFAHPHSPWERGSNENLNRIVREFFPKDSDAAARRSQADENAPPAPSAPPAPIFGPGVTITSDPNYLAMVASEINDRPRKIHNWKKPSELFAELVETHASTG